MDSFERYQRESAWIWEHMALARARVLFGPEADRDALNAMVHAVLTKPHDPETLRDEVLAMRGEMARYKAAKGPLDVKLVRGGLVDVEFIVHFLQLREGRALDPSLPTAIALLVEDGLVGDSFAAAHAALTRFLIAARLLAPDSQEPPPAARAVLAKACSCRDWDRLLALLAESRAEVAGCWHATFGETLEI